MSGRLAVLTLSVLGCVACGPPVERHFMVKTPTETRCVTMWSLIGRPYYLSEGCVRFEGETRAGDATVVGPMFCGTVTVEPVSDCPKMPAEAQQ